MSRASKNANAVVKSVTDLLAAHKIWHMRMNTGALRGASGRPIFFGRKGMADVLATPFSSRECFCPRLLWVEAKSGSGRQSPDQKAFQLEVEEAGHSYIIARDGPEAVIAWLEEHGVIRHHRPGVEFEVEGDPSKYTLAEAEREHARKHPVPMREPCGETDDVF